MYIWFLIKKNLATNSVLRSVQNVRIDLVRRKVLFTSNFVPVLLIYSSLVVDKSLETKFVLLTITVQFSIFLTKKLFDTTSQLEITLNTTVFCMSSEGFNLLKLQRAFVTIISNLMDHNMVDCNGMKIIFINSKKFKCYGLIIP